MFAYLDCLVWSSGEYVYGLQILFLLGSLFVVGHRTVETRNGKPAFVKVGL